jgi:hypothetical protein
MLTVVPGMRRSGFGRCARSPEKKAPGSETGSSRSQIGTSARSNERRFFLVCRPRRVCTVRLPGFRNGTAFRGPSGSACAGSAALVSDIRREGPSRAAGRIRWTPRGFCYVPLEGAVARTLADREFRIRTRAGGQRSTPEALSDTPLSWIRTRAGGH